MEVKKKQELKEINSHLDVGATYEDTTIRQIITATRKMKSFVIGLMGL